MNLKFKIRAGQMGARVQAHCCINNGQDVGDLQKIPVQIVHIYFNGVNYVQYISSNCRLQERKSFVLNNGMNMCHEFS